MVSRLDRSRSRECRLPGKAPEPDLCTAEYDEAIISASDRALLGKVLGQAPGVMAYPLGDLEDPFFKDCNWSLLVESSAAGSQACSSDSVRAVALLYTGLDLPVLVLHPLTLEDASTEQAARRLMAKVQLPAVPRFECHCDVDLLKVLEARGNFDVEVVRHVRMVLTSTDALPELEPKAATTVVRLDQSADGIEAQRLSKTAPRTWFEPHQLSSGMYFGIYGADDGNGQRLLSMGGTHVFSPKYGVAALGGICTHPDAKRRGLGRAVVRQLCASLFAEGINTIALNVAEDNMSARALYEKLGFKTIKIFLECDVRRIS